MSKKKVVALPKEEFSRVRAMITDAGSHCEDIDRDASDGTLRMISAADLRALQRDLSLLVLWASKAQVGLYSAIRSAEANERVAAATESSDG
jgi:hypothetical protein